MKQSTVYLLLCGLGVAAPWLFLLGFFGGSESTLAVFFRSIFANPASSATAADLLVSAVAFFVLVFYEGRRLKMTRLWVFIPATLLVGLSFGLPLFLYFRARRMETL